MTATLALIGFGEAGSTFARAAGWAGSVCAFDIRAERAAVAADLGVNFAASACEAIAGCDLVLSLVTADAALQAANDCVDGLTRGALWCDMTSVAPATKQAAAAIIEGRGGHYIDVAVLAPVEPARLGLPLLVSGAAADRAAAALGAAGFANVRVVGDNVGRASAIKMIRSVMVKGIEALTAEMMLAATRAGVAADVLASLDASERMETWFGRAAYNIERMATHGLRRAAEMEESASTLVALGVDPIMTAATVQRQRAQAGHTIATPEWNRS